MKIFIDPGHNHAGGDLGAVGNGLKEQDVTFFIAEKLKELCISCGHEIKMSRNKITDSVGKTVAESINTRCSLANSWKADLFISIHCNAGGGTGVETYVYSKNSAALPCAQQVQKQLSKNIGWADRGVKFRTDLGVLRGTSMPAMLVECGFIDNDSDANKMKTMVVEIATAIFKGLGFSVNSKNVNQEQTVMRLPNEVYVQEIEPSNFTIKQCGCAKNNVNEVNYFNLGFFTTLQGGGTIPVGNLAIDGRIISQAKDNANWINLSGKKLTTIYTSKDGKCGITKIDNLDDITGLKTAVSGIPIILGGKYISMDDIKSEGYFGNELYDTWHGFLGIRHGKLCYVAAKCDFGQMCWMLVALGIYDAIKLDGGGSFILYNGKKIQATSENRIIDNIGIWK